MSKYTTEVRFICEQYAGLTESVGYSSIKTVIADARENVFDFDYPIYDNSYKSVLETKILAHYYTREICAETVGLWKHFLSARMNEIMPYYNQLYESALLKFNPFHDVDLTKEYLKNNNGKMKDDGNETSTSSSTRAGDNEKTRTDNLTRTDTSSGSDSESETDVKKNTRWDIYSDAPQGALTNVDNETYLTNARKIIDDGTGSAKSSTTTYGKVMTGRDTGTVQEEGTFSETGSENGRKTHANVQTLDNTEDYIEHITGKTPGASYSKLLKEYRDTILNIDMMIIDDLGDLFFNLW